MSEGPSEQAESKARGEKLELIVAALKPRGCTCPLSVEEHNAFYATAERVYNTLGFAGWLRMRARDESS